MRLLIVDDHEVVRRGVRSLLSEQSGWEVCGEAVDGQDALEKARKLHPDLIVMDVSMPRLNGLEATRQVRILLPQCEVLVLSQHESAEMARQALQAGARGYVVKSSISRDLIAAVTTAAKGDYFFDPAILEQSNSSHIDVQEILQRSAAFERALRESEELYRSTFEFTAIGISHVAPDGRWLRVNKRICEITGYSEAELLRLTFQEMTHPDDLAGDLALTETLIRGELETFSLEKRYIRKDGSHIWVNLTVSCARDADGKLKHFISVIEDISRRKRVEEALQHSQRQLALALQSSRTAMFDWDVAKRQGTWNPQMAAIYDFTPKGQYITTEEWRSLFHPEDVERLTEEAERAWSGTDEQFTFEFRTAPRDGKTRWMVSHGRVVRDSSGRPIRMIGTHTDITDRKQTETATGLLASIVASSDDAIVSKTLDGIITSWNTGAERMFGYTADEAVGQHITLIIPKDRYSEETDILARLRRGERLEHFQTVRRRKDGTLFDVSVTISPVRDASGRIVGASKVARDISAQMQADKALRESEQRYRLVTDASPVMLWMSGTDKLCYYFNKGWLEFVGRTLEKELGNGWTENVHPDDFERCLQIYVSNFDARLPFEMEYRLRHHSGQYRWIFDRGVPRYKPDGTFEGYVGGCLDIHDRKEAAEKIRAADEALRLMRSQDEERRRIARELHDSAGQTLAVLGLNLAQLVQRAEVIAPELAKDGKEIEEIVQQLHREIRTTSYLLHPPLLDEAGLKSALSWYVQGVAERSGMLIDLNVGNNFGRLPADMELAIFRVVQECLTNIHRHAESKTAHIRVSREDESVRIEVRDGGKGISPDRLSEIHSRASGVGIAGIRERLRQFRGEMKIESNGSGTTVFATIPIPKEAPALDLEPAQAALQIAE
jgi:PAS domain S-box-containing protein